MTSAFALPAIIAVTVVTIVIGAYGLRFARTTSDFLVASRTISPPWNASAISGEYLSAASFLGVAGLVMKFGADVLWYPVGFAAGYLALLLFVAAPLRRSGAFTLPDFAEARLRSRAVRRWSVLFVVVVGTLYLVPQLQGAGLTLTTLTGAPYWVGAVVVGAVVTLNVATGGMRAITFVQAFQYWLKLTAISVPAFFLFVVWQSGGLGQLTGATAPVFDGTTTVAIETSVRFDVADPLRLEVDGEVDGRNVSGTMTLTAGEHEVAAGTELTFPAGTAVPHVEGLPALDGRTWAAPLGSGGGFPDYPLLATYSLILATFLGTMGLPHVLVRFYTNPDGRAARRTTLIVLGLLGVFYLFPTLYGALGRLYVPQLLITGQTDAVVLLLPGAAVGGWVGQVLGALVAAGAFAAFLSTASGLLVSVAGVLSTDVLGRGSVRDFRLAAVASGIVPLLIAIQVDRLDVSQVVGLAFAVAASTFCPLLVLGIWWRGLTDVGALAGMLVGGGLCLGAVLFTVFGPSVTGLPGVLLAQPAAWSVPVSFVVMIVGSRLSAGRVPADINATMLTLHAPESLGLGRRPG